ncbi:hypothetical protein D3X11_05760 [Streptococcus sp. X16XC17]|uniref:hypothetical protein n=1 Tax=unclassified Streptococcus TaxID=2608887 RepID=UPI00066FCEB1|nr:MULTISPECIES: hypothetical protein [unclassified Streptococcus]TCD45727.1 hypothetical protein D3X11_05760 [Streptococcus sp. X16XC17]
MKENYQKVVLVLAFNVLTFGGFVWPRTSLSPQNGWDWAVNGIAVFQLLVIAGLVYQLFGLFQKGRNNETKSY